MLKISRLPTEQRKSLNPWYSYLCRLFLVRLYRLSYLMTFSPTLWVTPRALMTFRIPARARSDTDERRDLLCYRTTSPLKRSLKLLSPISLCMRLTVLPNTRSPGLLRRETRWLRKKSIRGRRPKHPWTREVTDVRALFPRVQWQVCRVILQRISWNPLWLPGLCS